MIEVYRGTEAQHLMDAVKGLNQNKIWSAVKPTNSQWKVRTSPTHLNSNLVFIIAWVQKPDEPRVGSAFLVLETL